MQWICKAIYRDSIVLGVTFHDDDYLTTTRSVQNKAILLLFPGGSWTEVFDRNIIVLDSSASTVGRAEYGNRALRYGSIFAAERVRTSGGYKTFRQSSTHKIHRNL